MRNKKGHQMNRQSQPEPQSDNRTTPLLIRVEPDLAEQIKQAARARGYSMSSFLRQLAVERLRKMTARSAA